MSEARSQDAVILTALRRLIVGQSGRRIWDETSTQSAERLSRLVMTLVLSPVVIVVAAGVRLLLVANYDVPTAIEIASSVGVTGTLLGTIVPLLPPFLPLFCLILLFLRKWLSLVLAVLATSLVSPVALPVDKGFVNAWNTFYSGLLAKAVQFDFYAIWNNWPFAIACAGVALFVILLDPPDSDSILRRFLAVAIIPMAILSALFLQSSYSVPRGLAAMLSPVGYVSDLDNDTVSYLLRRPWVPVELIRLSPDGVVVGYTLSTQDGWFVVLKERDRSIEFISADTVESRSVCIIDPDIQVAKLVPAIPLQGVNINRPRLCPG